MLTATDNEILTRTGPGTPMGDLFRRFWLPALLPAELPEPDCPPVRFRILGEDLVAFRDSSGRVGFLDQACPHRRVSLYFGRNEEDGLRCVYHGWKFDVDGNCVDMPNEPAQSNFAGKVKAKSYPAAEWGGLIWIYMGPKDKQPELPQYDWCLAPSPDQQVWKWMQESNYAQGLEGNIDSSHVSFLHRWFGKMPDYLESGAPALMAKETDFGFIYGARRPSDDELFHWRVTAFVLPVYTVIPNRSGKGAGFFVVPMDDEHSWWFTIQRAAPLDLGPARDAYVDLIPGTFRQTRNKDNDYLLDREMQRTQNYSGLPTNRVQDCAVTESMGPVVDRTRERLGTSDVAIIFMRRLLIRLARELQEGREPALLKHAEWHNILPLDVDDPQPDLATLWDAHSSELVVPTVKA